MILRHWIMVAVVGTLVALLPGFVQAQLEEPLLERYVIGHGPDPASAPGGVHAFVQDDDFGHGTAQASVFFDTGSTHDFMHLRVWRYVDPDEIVFALLVFRVEIRGYDQASKIVYTRDLPAFSFGDSASGNWYRKLRLPKKAHRWEISFIGNYE